MRNVFLVVILAAIAMAAYFEFTNVRTWSLFGTTDLYANIFLILLAALTLLFFILGIQRKRSDRIPSFIPATLGCISIAIMLIHKWHRKSIYNSETVLEAINYDIGSDGGFRMDFKANKKLIAEKVDKFSSTFYYGSYDRRGDSFVIKLPLDFKLSSNAHLIDNHLRFSDGTVFDLIEIFKQDAIIRSP